MREDWIEIGFKDIVDKIATSNYKVKQKDYLSAGDFPIIDQGQELIGGYENDEKKVLECDLPLVVFGDHTRCVKFINFQFIPGADGIKVLVPKIFIAPKFLYYVVNILANKIENKGYARHYQLLEKQLIGLPPLPEQRAIVKKLESLLSSLDAGVADLKKAQQQLKMYRQAVLKKAFEGEWDKKKIIETCSNIKVGIVIKPTQFYSSDNTGVKVFRSANVKEFRIQDSNWVYFSLQGNEINKRTQVKEDDILIVRTGYPGTSCIVTKEYVNTNAIDILIATPDKNIILPKYLCAFNNSPYGKGLFSEGSRGVAQKHLNVGVYSNLIIPVPPIKNQLKIIKQLESGLSVCDSIEQNIKESLEKAEALRQSILKKAFEGNLLTAQELAECKLADDYEPASVLLERIKAEQTEIKAKPSKKKPRHSVAKSQ